MRMESLQNEQMTSDNNNGDLCPAAVIDTRAPAWKRELTRKRSAIVTHGLKQSGYQQVTVTRTCFASGGLVAAMAAVFDPRFRAELATQQIQITAIKDARLGPAGFSAASRSQRDNGVTTFQHGVNQCFATQQTTLEQTAVTEQQTTLETRTVPKMDSLKSAEEFQYGPGIVQRLKSRFLSSEQGPVPLRRTAPLTRTASLENWLDCDPLPHPVEGVFQAVPVASPDVPKPRPSSLILQKTRSVDILSFTEPPPRPKLTPSLSVSTPATPVATPLAFTAFAKEDLVIIEKNDNKETVSLPQKESPTEKKVPPAAPPVPKPRRIPPMPARLYSANSGEFPAPDTVRNVKSLFESHQSSKVSSGRNFSVSNRVGSIAGSNPQKENVNVQTLNEENRPKPASSLHRSKPLTSTGPLKTLQRTSAVQEDPDTSDTRENHAEDSRIGTSGTKRISPVALENIRKEGVSLKFNFSGHQKQVGIIRPIPKVEKAVIPEVDKVALPKVEKVPTPKVQVKQAEAKKELPKETVSIPVNKSPIPAATAATHAPPKSVAVSQSVAKSQAKENGTSSGPRTRKWHQDASSSTIVFNFKERKETPDYIANKGGHHTNGVVLHMNPASESSDQIDNLEENLSSPKQPQPCRIQFEGANVIINGKSSIRSKNKTKTLNISFKDDLIKVFEYPSESSLMESMSAEEESSSITATAASTNGSTASSFANYTPKVNVQDTFELGVSRIVSAPLVAPTTPPPPPPVEEFAVPTQDGSSWSTENSADLLF